MSGVRLGVWANRVMWFILAACAITLPACTSSTPIEVITIEPQRYGEAFDVVLEVARAEGMPASLRDRRSGVIETAPVSAPSYVEPWRLDGASISQRSQNTISHQRRRARFEFTPAGFQPIEESDEPLAGPDLLSMVDPERDMLQYGGPLELRVWVYLERVHENGIRRDEWTRGKTTRTAIITYDDEGQPHTEPGSFWTVESRETDFAARLLERRPTALDPAASGREG